MASTASLRLCAHMRTRFALSRCAMKRLPPLPPAAMPSIPAASACVWRLQARAGFTFSTGSMMPNSTASPCWLLPGHTFHDLIGTHHQQDVDLDKLFIDVAAYNQRIMGPSHASNAVDEAIKTALSRRTVAHLTIPKDIQDWTQDETERSAQNIPQHSGIMYTPS